ncbi:MAG TPA: GspH/FimT family pseudopilin [Longimicrobium sp.]|nr:GspH/FimT family pseudopilin [Longimicrobium sp.]
MGYGRGYTLFEMMATLVIAGIALSIAVPGMEGVLRRERVRGAMNRLAGDLEYTRMAAVRNGRSTVFRFIPGPGCPPPGGTGYHIRVKGSTTVLRQWYPADGVHVCYWTNNADSLVYNSRGLLAPFNNRTIRGVLGGARDSLTISSLGRIYRRW